MTGAPLTNWPPTIGHYALYGEIASGGMATVHFGRLQGAAGFARSVAIKRLHPQYARDPDFVAMFLDEARLAARVSHPNVVPTLDVVSQGEELFLVMEYVRGASLSRLVRTLKQKGERIPPRIAAAIVSGVLHGLHAAHEAKSETGERLDIVHRDVSPQNVLVGTDGIARVLDFGVAKAAGRVQSTREGQLKGKLSYMAPEQITAGVVTRKTDIYAAAVMLWEVLAGRRLFSGENEAKVLSLVLGGEVVPPSQVVPELPEGFDRVVLRGLDRDPAVRFATAREMASELEAIVGVAPSTEIGEWVQDVAADELRERANRIEEIERSVPSSSGMLPGMFSVTRTLDGPSVLGCRRVEEPATVQLGARAAPGREPSQPPSLAVAPAEAPQGRSRRAWAGRILAVAAGIAIGAVLFTLHPWRSRPDTTPSLGGPPSVALPERPPDSPFVAPPPPAVSATARPPSVAPTVSALNPTPARVWRVAPSAGPAPSGAPPPPYCNPPYTADEKGHVHFKPQCL